MDFFYFDLGCGFEYIVLIYLLYKKERKSKEKKEGTVNTSDSEIYCQGSKKGRKSQLSGLILRESKALKLLLQVGTGSFHLVIVVLGPLLILTILSIFWGRCPQ